MTPTCRFRLALIPVTALMLAGSAQAAPEVRTVSVRGLQIDGTTTIRIDGTGLLPNPQLASSVPITRQTVKPGATETRVEFDVTLDGSVEPGLYNLWLANGAGVSAPSVVAVDRLPQSPFAPEVSALPVALHGTISGSTRLRTAFAAKAGESLLIAVEAQRLGGKLRPVLHVFDADNQQLDWTLPSPTLRGDARLKFTAPADGQYTVELHDLQYAAPAPNFFRLKIGTWQHADQVFPSAVQIGTQVNLSLIGHEAEASVPFTAASSPASSVGFAPWSDARASGGFRPPVLLSSFPEYIEEAASTEPQAFAAVPAAMNGRLLEPAETDRFLVSVTTGAKLRFEVFADRIGSPIDAILELQNDKGGRLSLNDDVPGTPDSRIDYTVPANVTSVIVAIKDANGRSGRDCIYRVAVTPLPGPDDAPDFRLRLTQQRHSVAAGNRVVVKVEADRTNYDGPIELKFNSPLVGIETQGTTIAAGESGALVTLHGSGVAVSNALTSLRGVAEINGQSVHRTAFVESHVLAKLQPWLSEEIGVAVTASSATGFKTDWGTLPPDTQLALGGKLDLPVSAIRPAGFDGSVRLILETSQLPVRAGNNQIDANRTLRSETNQPIEIVVDATAQKAWDAKLAADKVVVDSQTNLATVAAAAKKPVTAADATVKATAAQLVTAKEAAAKAIAAAKTAGDADTTAQQTLTAAATAATAAADAVQKIDESDTTKLSEAAKTAAAAAEAAKVAAARKAATAKTLATAAAQAKQASDALTAAEKTAADAATVLKTAMEAAAKTNADAAAKVKDAEAKQLAALKAAETAAATAKNDGVFSVFVPAELNAGGYQLALRAELLSRDKKTVLDRTCTAVRRVSVLNPLVVAVNDNGQLSGVIDPKAGVTISVSGKLNRLAGMNQAVTVTLSGLPAGIAVPKVVLKPDQSDFKLEVKFPATFKPADLNSIQAFATGKMRANAPIAVRSKDVPVAISLKAMPEAAPSK